MEAESVYSYRGSCHWSSNTYFPKKNKAYKHDGTEDKTKNEHCLNNTWTGLVKLYSWFVSFVNIEIRFLLPNFFFFKLSLFLSYFFFPFPRFHLSQQWRHCPYLTPRSQPQTVGSDQFLESDGSHNSMLSPFPRMYLRFPLFLFSILWLSVRLSLRKD